MDILSQHEAFLRAIFDAPDDDTPRLVYADFLQENGEDLRAELIRVQCEMARFEPSDDAESRQRFEELARQQDEIAKRYPSPVFAHKRGFKAVFSTHVRVRIDELQDTAAFRARAVHSAPECFAATSVELFGGRITSAHPFDALFGLAAFARANWLVLQGDEVVEEKPDDSPFTPYRIEPVVTLSGVEALVAHRGARKLTTLVLTHNNLDNDAARALVKSPYLDNLKRLDLFAGNRFRGKVWQQVIERFGEEVVG
jgi:uncharacterized protein (TIGR02996 family)